MSGTVLFEECDLVFADVCAVLDRVNAAFECNGYAERTFNVRRNLETEFVRLVAARFYDFGGHTQHAGFAFFLASKTPPVIISLIRSGLVFAISRT